MVVALVLALAFAPTADAKGGSSSSGRRNCTATDTNGDGYVSGSESDEQCGDSLTGFEGALIAFGLLGAGGFALYQRFVGPGWVQIGEKGTLNGRPFVVIGSLGFRNEDGDIWEEWLLDVQGGRKIWLEIDEGKMILHGEWNGARGDIQPATVNGETVSIDERGSMHVTGRSGVIPPGHDVEGNVPYVDGRIREGRVSLEGDRGDVTVYRSARATGKTGHGIEVGADELRRLLG